MTREDFFKNLEKSYDLETFNNSFENEFVSSKFNELGVAFRVSYNYPPNTITIDFRDTYKNSRGHKAFYTNTITMFENFDAYGNTIKGFDFDNAFKKIKTWMDDGFLPIGFVDPRNIASDDYDEEEEDE